MPIYEYKCQDCGQLTEKLVRTDNDIPRRCPACNGDNLKKKFSTFSAAVTSTTSAPACADTGTCPTGSCCQDGTCPL